MRTLLNASVAPDTLQRIREVTIRKEILPVDQIIIGQEPPRKDSTIHAVPVEAQSKELFPTT